MKKLIILSLLLLPTKAQAKVDYPSYAVNNLVEGCINSGTLKTACYCIADEYRKNISYEQFKNMEERAGTGDQTKSDKELINKVASNCFNRTYQQ